MQDGAAEQPEFEIRPATSDDADAVGDVYLSAFRATYDFPVSHGDDAVRAWLAGAIEGGGVWVATADDGEVVALMRLEGDQLDQLYVRPGWWGRGIGSSLVELAKRERPAGLSLWTFQVNARARHFYEQHGFVELLATDGAHNEERQPDVLLGWRPPVQGAEGWDSVYAGAPPWDIGRPQAAFQALADAGWLRGDVLDVGCGTGEHTLMAAALGHPATGVDIAGSALVIAREKAATKGIQATFVRWDATELGALGRTWPTALDCGLFHVFDDADRARYVRALGAAIEPGGQYAMLAFSDRQIGTNGPRRVTQAEIRSAFAGGWTIRSIEPAILETRVPFDPAATEAGQHGAQAWLSIIERDVPAGSG